MSIDELSRNLAHKIDDNSTARTAVGALGGAVTGGLVATFLADLIRIKFPAAANLIDGPLMLLAIIGGVFGGAHFLENKGISGIFSTISSVTGGQADPRVEAQDRMDEAAERRKKDSYINKHADDYKSYLASNEWFNINTKENFNRWLNQNDKIEEYNKGPKDQKALRERYTNGLSVADQQPLKDLYVYARTDDYNQFVSDQTAKEAVAMQTPALLRYPH